jgi:hypothetical protein
MNCFLMQDTGLKVEVQSQWKALKKGEVEENKACWSLGKYYLGSTSTSLAGTLYPGVTYLGHVLHKKCLVARSGLNVAYTDIISSGSSECLSRS